MENKSKHTPGGWEVANVAASRACWTRWSVVDRATRTLIAEIDGKGPGEPEANARLIAAAPDLLAVCKRLAAFIDDGMPEREAEMLRAALAKAEGGA